MVVELTDEQNALIKKIAEENGFSDYEVITNPGSVKGDNFLGVLTNVLIKNGNRTLDLILKSAHREEGFRKVAPLRNIYLREIHIYQKLFDELKKFQDDCNIIDPFESHPKLCGACTVDTNECFVMENLKSEGYQLWDRKVTMSIGHIKAVLREYAKFHCASVALKHKNPELFYKLIENLAKHVFDDDIKDDEKMNLYIKTTLANGYKVVEDDPVLSKILDKIAARIPKMFTEEFQFDEYKVSLVHGDCWCNNFLFKYKDENNKAAPFSLRIIDWQLTFLSCPAYDVSYFFLVHADKETLYNYKEYLKFYYDTFSSQLKQFNLNPNELYPYEKFEEHFKKYAIFAMYMCLMILKIMLSDSGEVPDFSKATDETGFIEGMNFETKNFDLYQERIKTLLQFFKDHESIFFPDT